MVKKREPGEEISVVLVPLEQIAKVAASLTSVSLTSPLVRKVLSELDLFLECLVGTVEGFGDTEGLFCATNLVDEWFEELSCMVAVNTDSQYNFHLG